MCVPGRQMTVGSTQRFYVVAKVGEARAGAGAGAGAGAAAWRRRERAPQPRRPMEILTSIYALLSGGVSHL